MRPIAWSWAICHARGQVLGEQHRRPKVHVECPVQFFGREIIERSRRRQCRVRDQDVGILNLGEKARDLVPIGEVALQHPGIFELRSQGVESVHPTAGQH
jgi:hypothetical protein